MNQYEVPSAGNEVLKDLMKSSAVSLLCFPCYDKKTKKIIEVSIK